MAELLLDVIEQHIATLREQLRARYGWTHLDVHATFEDQRVHIRGTVAVPSLANRLRTWLEPLLEPGTSLQIEVGPMPTLSWHALPDPLLELYAEHPTQAKRSLATELLRDDGPIALLAEAPPGLLVRARDGTVGWMIGSLDQLGPRTAPRLLSAPTLPEDPSAALLQAALAQLGIPYVLGGTSPTRIDCSGLTARTYAAALGITLPRHSTDQLAIAGGGDPVEHAEGSAGDLLFVRSRSLGRSHVAMASGRDTVIHASRSRNGVIEERASELEGDAEWIRRARWQAIVDWSRAHVGRPNVELP